MVSHGQWFGLYMYWRGIIIFRSMSALLSEWAINPHHFRFLTSIYINQMLVLGMSGPGLSQLKTFSKILHFRAKIKKESNSVKMRRVVSDS